MAGFFSFNKNATAEATVTPDLIRPYNLSIAEQKFIQTMTILLFERILKRCYHKTAGISERNDDNIAQSVFLSSEYGAQKNGTIPLVARAITNRRKIYLVYSEKASLVHEASMDERNLLDKQYKDNNNAIAELGDGRRGMVLDFTQYDIALIVKCYMSLIYAVMDSANTQVNLSRSIQIKISKLRDNISVLTSDDAIKQVNNINDALKNGNGVLVDVLDMIEQTKIDSSSITAALEMFYKGLASVLGLSMSFVSGVLTSGMSATGDADINYEDAGIKDYWTSIWRPIMLKLYGEKNVKYRTDRWRTIGQKLQNLILIENSTLISDEQKMEYAQDILNDEI